MVDTFDLTVRLLSGDKVYYNLSRVAVKRYISYYDDKCYVLGHSVEPSIETQIHRELDHILKHHAGWNC